MVSSPLVIYKASAGSGKTFTLAVEYIRLLVANPWEYRHILAVTFTNKATSEMKSRILEQLYGIARGLKESEDYLNAVMNGSNFSFGVSEIRHRADLALNLIIHDYSHFRIETIDSFFQSIIRDLAHELDLTANLKVDLNQNDVLAEAVADIIDRLDVGSQMFGSIIDFIEDKIDGGQNWAIDDEVAKFGMNIFNEKYLERQQSVRDRIGDPQFLKNYKKRLADMERSIADLIESYGKCFIEECERHGLSPDNFKYGKTGVYNTFVKLTKFRNLANKERSSGFVFSARAMDCLNGDDFVKSWVKPKDENPVLVDLVQNKFQRLLSDAKTCFEEKVVVYNSILAIKKHINHLMLLNVINARVRDLNAEANRFLLADTAHFLRDLIDESDVPFIYEKTGTRFNHIMIDEFQDTSSMQWQNFIPLLSNCVDEGHFSMIVGDVKQSIYRWRNGDWSILNNISSSKFGKKGQIDVRSLGTNFRSAERIISFNNTFFRKAIHSICDDTIPSDAELDVSSGEGVNPDIEQAYSDVCQGVSPRNMGCGYVSVELLGSSDADVTYEEVTLSRMKDLIYDLISKGVEPNDITILVRFNKKIPVITDYFAQNMPEIKIASDEAFRLDSSDAVKLLVCALRAVANHDDKLAIGSLAYYYQTMINRNIEVEENINLVFAESIDNLLNVLPDDFSKNIEKLAVTPLYELTEELYRIFSVDKIEGQSAYLFAFYDKLSSFIEDKGDDITSFLTYWDDELCSVTIPNSSSDGIRIMSIHKSKGLEFHTVIVPFCDWQIKNDSRDMLWCELSDPDFNELPLAPIKYDGSLENSIFRDDFEEEELRKKVDNLNLVYVAFTRAEKNLIILSGKSGRKSKKDSETESLSIYKILKESEPDFMEKEEKDESICYTYGEVSSSVHKKSKVTENVLSMPYAPCDIAFRYYDSRPEFRQSNKSQDFINGVDDEEVGENLYINEGLLFHRFFSKLGGPEDIDKVAEELDGEGCFRNLAYKNNVVNLVKQAFDKTDMVKDWFSSKWTVFNECSILYKDDCGIVTERRPDRVITDGENTIVIDYKTGKQNVEHVKQVAEYMELLRKMNYPNVVGYVWYIRRGDIVRV